MKKILLVLAGLILLVATIFSLVLAVFLTLGTVSTNQTDLLREYQGLAALMFWGFTILSGIGFIQLLRSGEFK